MRRRVLLVAAPFSALNYPSMALSLLKPCLVAAGIPCDVRYLTFPFADRIGYEAQECATDNRYYHALVGDWIFAGAAHGGEGDPGPDLGLSYFGDVFARHHPEHFTPERVMRLLGARATVEPFLDECLEQVHWDDYALIGFTSSFQQNAAALALARRVKRRWPHLFIAFGGANCRGAMGRELLRQYAFIDAVCTEEGERAFPLLARDVIEGGAPIERPGIARRGAAPSDGRGPATPPDLESLPVPDFSDFYLQHAASDVARRHYPPAALFETSRGCWWGAKHHCTFCGINGDAMAYRSKSPDRAYAELSEIVARHGGDIISVDTILDPGYFETLLPRIARNGPRITAYFELKVNLRPDQIRLLAESGIRKIQPGIESLDSGLLALMRKGTTLVQNVQTLRLAAEAGVFVEWNLLYGIPGETPDAYERMAALIPSLAHLQPPQHLSRVRADRFSPYQTAPSRFGVTIEPAPAYAHIYPFDRATLDRLAYHFDIRSDALDDAPRYAGPALAACRAWQGEAGLRRFYWLEDEEGIAVIDERADLPAGTHPLSGADEAVFRACELATSPGRLAETLAGAYTPAEVDAAVARLAAFGALLVADGRCLRLPLRGDGPRTAPSWSQVRDLGSAEGVAGTLSVNAPGGDGSAVSP